MFNRIPKTGNSQNKMVYIGSWFQKQESPRLGGHIWSASGDSFMAEIKVGSWAEGKKRRTSSLDSQLIHSPGESINPLRRADSSWPQTPFKNPPPNLNTITLGTKPITFITPLCYHNETGCWETKENSWIWDMRYKIYWEMLMGRCSGGRLDRCTCISHGISMFHQKIAPPSLWAFCPGVMGWMNTPFLVLWPTPVIARRGVYKRLQKQWHH